MAAPRTSFLSLRGRFGIGQRGNLVHGTIDVTPVAADATITVSAEDTNVRQVDVQLKDAYGNNIVAVEELDLVMFLDVARVAYVVTGGSTGLEIDDAGVLVAVTAKKRWKALTNAAGLLALKTTDTQTEVMFLGVRLPGGRWIMSSALTMA